MTLRPRILCLGAMLWDVIGRSPVRQELGGDHAGIIVQRPGGVALNVALALAKNGLSPAILGAVGRDSSGDMLVREAERQGVVCRYLHRDCDGTDIYMAIEDSLNLVAAVADARALEAAGEAILAPLRDGRLGSAKAPFEGMIILDSNPPAEVLAGFASDPALQAAVLRIVPASPSKVARLDPLLTRPRTLFYLNRAEAEAIAGRPAASSAEAAEAVIARGAERVIVTDGPHPASEAMRAAPTHSATPHPVEIRRLTGAGDWLLAAHVKAESAGAPRDLALVTATAAAADYVSGKDPS
ncbi:PfkB family carbohydrate kinase [Paracoccus aminophilus]|nr:PfkB family carbohydrate kinase [Paracoccus aminophilus]